MDGARAVRVTRLVRYGGERSEETNTTENESEMLMRRACARALSLLLERSLQATPSPLDGVASWPLLGACTM